MDYEIVRSNRRTLSIEIKPDGRVIVKAPLFMSKAAIDYFVRQKEDWIEKNKEKVLKKNRLNSNVEKFTEEELKVLKKRAKNMILPLVEDYAEIMGLEYGTVSIRAQHSRWGSCSGKGNLNFNCLLALCPEACMRYVVVHELCHIRHMNHSKAFWREVEEYMPDYKIHRKWLKNEGNGLIARLP